MPTITRKIQLLVDDERANVSEVFTMLYGWQDIVRKAANMIASHCFVQDNIKDLFYIVDGVKLKLADQKKDKEGIFDTSKTNTTYRLLSKHFKGEIPTSILTCLNSVVTKTYSEERVDLYKGKVSLRNYKGTIPIPFRVTDIRGLKKEGRNYNFILFGIPFKTHFGADRSNNEELFDRAVFGEYKFCISSIQIKGKKIFLLAAFKFEKNVIKFKNNAKLTLRRGDTTPLIAKYRAEEYEIGTIEELQHGRLSIQAARKRIQRALKYTKGGKGRKRKLQALKQFEEKEKNYIETKIHTYSKEVINFCLRKKIGLIVIDNEAEKEEEKKLIASWSYYGFIDKLKYKAAIYNIILEIKSNGGGCAS